MRYLSNYNKFIAMNKNNYRLNLNDKNGIKAGIISLILGALVFYVFVWKINDKIPSFQICGDWCPGQIETLLNHPIHLFGGFGIWYLLIKFLFLFFLKSEWMDKNNYEIL